MCRLPKGRSSLDSRFDSRSRLKGSMVPRLRETSFPLGTLYVLQTYPDLRLLYRVHKEELHNSTTPDSETGAVVRKCDSDDGRAHTIRADEDR